MTIAPPENTTPVRDAHRFDEAALETWLRTNVSDFGPELVVRQFRGGQSNPTFWVGDGLRGYVLRKKPPGPILPSAHAVEREYEVIRALRDTDVPVARAVALCTDADVIGTPFYLMEHLTGRIFFDPRLPGLPMADQRALYEELAKALAAIHRVDVNAVGLGQYGKVGGYVARQTKRWVGQYEATTTGDVPSMNAIIRYLGDHAPSTDETALSHGDFRMDNVIFHATENRPLAVIDWELSTLGHPLADLAYTCMLYDVTVPGVGGLAGLDPATCGVPSEREFIATYERHLGRRVPMDDFAYFKAFSLFRLAAIAQGVYKRSQLGNASSENAAMYGAAVGALSTVACRLVGIDAKG